MDESAVSASCSFCLRGRSEVARMFTGPLDAQICNHCVATCQDELTRAAVPHQPGIHCLACGFEIRAEPGIVMLKGSICRGCAGQIAAKFEHAV